jgi:type I restriction enzyme S subunit
MSSNQWKSVKLENLLVKIIDNRGKNPPFSFDGYPYIDTTCIVGDNRFPDYSLVRKYIAEETYQHWFRSGHPQKNDILIATVGANIGKICLMDDTKACIAQNTIGLMTNNQIANPVFLYYVLSSNEKQGYLKSLDIGSAQPSIKVPHLLNIKIDLPPLHIQNIIAHILSSLDEKIELNRQTNVTLDAIAQAIFKEWFVDFNFPGATGEMVESELGSIPKGWRVGRLREVCNITMGQSPPGESYNENGEGVPFYQGRTDFGFRFPKNRVYTTNPKRYANKFDTLVSVRAPVGDMNIATETCCIGRGLASVIEKNGNFTFTYYLLNRLTEKFKKYEGTGTVFGSINKKDFEEMTFIVPSEHLISLFEKVCRSTDETIYLTWQENETLTSIRDNLLPKLMNGEIEL